MPCIHAVTVYEFVHVTVVKLDSPITQDHQTTSRYTCYMVLDCNKDLNDIPQSISIAPRPG